MAGLGSKRRNTSLISLPAPITSTSSIPATDKHRLASVHHSVTCRLKHFCCVLFLNSFIAWDIVMLYRWIMHKSLNYITFGWLCNQHGLAWKFSSGVPTAGAVLENPAWFSIDFEVRNFKRTLCAIRYFLPFNMCGFNLWP